MKLTHKQELLLAHMKQQHKQEYFEIREVYGTKHNGKRMPLAADLGVLVEQGLLRKTKTHKGQATYYIAEEMV